MQFEDFDLEYEVLDGLEAMNFYEATPVQEATIPLLLEGYDMIACAQTGTGKTAAYLLPILNKLCRGEAPEHKVNAVIMVPTRELALQIEQQLDGFSYFMPVSSVAIYGGTDGITFAQQQRGLTEGVDIVIATPGRLISMLNLKNVDLSEVSYFVLDEADRMLDMGFMEDILQIKAELPKSCQTVMFSATMPPKIKKFAKSILHEPREVELAISKPPTTIVQQAYICYEGQKVDLLAHYFSMNSPERSIVFCSSKLKCKEVARRVHKLGIKSGQMHSDLSQEAREEVMKDFKNGNIDLLIATDIVARGIDIDNIRIVMNFDIPHDPEDYVHRIGRTARGGNDEGLAVTLVSEKEQTNFAEIEDFLGYKLEYLPIPEELGAGPEYAPKRKKQGGRGFRRNQRKGQSSQSEGTPKGKRPFFRKKKKTNDTVH